MIVVENVEKEFALTSKQRKEIAINSKTIKAVNNVSFECKPGRIFSILGPNGAGKTTMLRMISTILKPTGGKINVCGFDTVLNSKEVRSKIGFLTGTTGLYERLTPSEIIKYFANLYQMSNTAFRARKEELFELLGIHSFQDKKIGQLSSGMKQKVSIVRSMIHDPDVVIFDEPTTGLDVITAKNIIELIRDSKKKGKTVIFSSHIMSEVDLLCDDLLILHKGKTVFNDTMEIFRKEMTASGLTEEFIEKINKFENIELTTT